MVRGGIIKQQGSNSAAAAGRLVPAAIAYRIDRAQTRKAPLRGQILGFIGFTSLYSEV